MQTPTQEPMDALDLLAEDHRRVGSMFDRYDAAADETARRRLADAICDELSIHAQLEQELFYGALRDAVGGSEALVDDAEVEHGTLRHIVETLQEATPGQRHYDANVRVLGVYLRQHVEEEQERLFPRARESGMDLVGLGREMQARRRQLLEERGLGPMPDPGPAPEDKLHSADPRHI
jgi:hemerythrin-like domain-containing protein